MYRGHVTGNKYGQAECMRCGTWYKVEIDQCKRCNKVFPLRELTETFTMQTYSEPSSFDGYICNNCEAHEAAYYKEQETKYATDK